jgi:hypothetical protein
LGWWEEGLGDESEYQSAIVEESQKRRAVLTDDNANALDPVVYGYWDLPGHRLISDSQVLTLQDSDLNLSEV